MKLKDILPLLEAKQFKVFPEFYGISPREPYTQEEKQEMIADYGDMEVVEVSPYYWQGNTLAILLGGNNK